MCINMSMVDPASAEKLSVLLEDLTGGKPLNQQSDVLGIVLALTALMLQAGEELHLPPPEIIGTLVQRAQVNEERAKNGQPPKLANDWLKDELEEQLAALKGEQPPTPPVGFVQPGGGVQAPNPFAPGEQMILPPKTEEPKDEGGQPGTGQYL